MFSCKLSVLFNNVCVFVFIWPLLMSVCVCVYMWIISTTKNYVGIKCIIFFLYFTLLLCFSFQRKSFVNEWVFVTCFFLFAYTPYCSFALFRMCVCVYMSMCACVHVCLSLRRVQTPLYGLWTFPTKAANCPRTRAHKNRTTHMRDYNKTNTHACAHKWTHTHTHHRPAAHSLAKPNAVDAECVCVECVSLSICLAGRYVRRDPGGQL